MTNYMDEKLEIRRVVETTPLIAPTSHRRRHISRRQRYPYRSTRGLFTVFLHGFAFVGLAFIAIFLVHPHLHSGNQHRGYVPWGTLRASSAWPQSEGIAYKDLEEIFRTTPQESRIRDTSKYYTGGPHVAGRNLSQAIWTRNRWQEFGVRNSEIVAYDIYMNFPVGHRLALLETNYNETKIKFEASLEEDLIPEDSTSTLPNRVPTFHGYSASGNVTAQYVYANYGTFKDFEDLVKANVTLKGKIALVRYGEIFRGLKIKRAQELGMVGTIIYSDPGDDNGITQENGYKAYPNGPARQPSSVQRGSVNYLSHAPGDPTTIGYPSKQGASRGDPKEAIPSIPSIPISYTDALPLLKALNGHGPQASDFGKVWQSGGLGYKGVHYNIGPSPPSLKLHLVNEQDYAIRPIWNVVGIINGTIPDEVIIMGNHRDAWIAGGAVDPNSGSAAMNEVVRGLGKALKAGWKPLRTIVLASWDGEENGLLGSTEWVEEYIPWLTHTAVAYINVDVAVGGVDFEGGAAPLLDSVLIDATYKIRSPNQTTKGQTVGDIWNKRISTLGSGSDFTAPQDFAGIPCVNIAFGGETSPPSVYHYHSNYDSFYWMDTFGDPGWHYHATLAKVWGVLALKLVDSPLIQFNATNYALALGAYVEKQKENAKQSPLANETLSFDKLNEAVHKLQSAAVALDETAEALQKDLDDGNSLVWYKWWKKSELFHKVRRVNQKYKYLERQFLHAEGLDGRTWFKHTVFAPGRWTGYAGDTFPGLSESLEDGDVKNFYKWQGIIAGQISHAAKTLA